MKKIYLILIILVIIFLFNKKDEIITVFNSYDYYEIYYLDFRNSNLTTENFLEYFDKKDIDIIKIEPYINPLYKNKLDFDAYLFDYNDIKTNIKKFKNYYLRKLKNLNYNEYTKYSINGIKINMVKVYTNELEIKKILKKDNNVKYMFNYEEYSKV